MITRSNSGGGSGAAFDLVNVDDRAELTYDSSRAVAGLAAKHEAGPGETSFYGYAESFGTSRRWFGRVNVWFPRHPRGRVQFIRATFEGSARLRVAISREGHIRVRDRQGEVIVASVHPIRTRRWQRIEWAVDHATGVVEIMIFRHVDSSVPTEVIRSRAGRRVGPAVDAVQFGASGVTHVSSAFWTDDPGLSHDSYLGEALP